MCNDVYREYGESEGGVVKSIVKMMKAAILLK